MMAPSVMLIAGVSSFTQNFMLSAPPTKTPRLACSGLRTKARVCSPHNGGFSTLLYEMDSTELERPPPSDQLSDPSPSNTPSSSPPDDKSEPESSAGSAADVVPAPATSSMDKPSASSVEERSTDVSEGSGGGGDWFTAVLFAYLAFVVLDTVFHILPDKSYVEMAIDAFGGGSSP
jgi:hypothetical protein